MKIKLNAAVALTMAAALGGVIELSSSCTRQAPSALKTIDPTAFQTMVETTAKELMLPGAVVLLRTPRGNSRSITAPHY